ncbi:MAG: tRNA uridine-5-carboxymethylaminomethyl(34) synthesis GTPase MnmE [Desulfosalsimonas sp.]
MSPESMDRSTIAAIATPEGFGGIGIIKVSGPDAFSVAGSVFMHGSYDPDNRQTSESAGKNLSFSPWRLYYGHIVDPDSGRMIDEVVLAVMPAPRSYTREDVVEIQAHAGPKVLHSILDLLITRGVRPARPGEFTRRAFTNGRIDLTQAEAVADLIKATSDAAVDMAVSQISGGLTSMLASIRETIISVLTTVEAAVDFPDSVDDEINTDMLVHALYADVEKPVQELLSAYEAGRFLRDGLNVVIAGGPNVGKSSLMNRLVNKERSIVTDIPGTTRDCIEATFTARGLPVVLVDTAGLRSDPGFVEGLGIEKARQYIESADFILYVVDVSAPVTSEDLQFCEELPRGRGIIVVNKCDLPKHQRRFERPAQWQGLPFAQISALYGEGVPELIDLLADSLSQAAAAAQPEFVPNWRQKVQLDRLSCAVSDAALGLKQGDSLELVSIDLRDALLAVDEITGRYVSDDILDRIFSSYCIGK